MAKATQTLQYSSSSLLLALLILWCFAETTKPVSAAAAVNSYDEEDDDLHHFHTLHFTSLFPQSLCTPSSSFTPGSKQRSSTLQVVHRHGPCSVPHLTTPPSLAEILAADESRVESIQAKLAPSYEITRAGKRNKYKDRKVDLPVQPGRSLGSGNYIVRVGLGTPPKTLSLIFDTGSDLTWTQCQPCARSCYQQQDPIFNPSSSSSYSNVSCASSQCSQLSSATGNTPGCSTKTCVYGIQYGDQSFSVGFLSKDTLTISKSAVFQNFFFGCGQNNQGLFGNTAGLIGLGRDQLSVVSQTAGTYGKYFSYCLPSSSSSTGHLSLGRSRASGSVIFTPFASSSQGAASNSFYFVDIDGISVGGRALSISQSVFQAAGGTIVDSGTVITRLPPAAYSALSTEFQQQMKKYPVAPAYSILDTCYDFSNYTNTKIVIPTISFTFRGNAKVNLDASGILIAINGKQACLAFAGNSDSSTVAIFGNTQQKTLEVVYDVAGGRLGFGAGGCK
ncbi:aspartyl protease family protein At5g10770-like isoform X2 [Andrographis paniculata]|uniref:aspartyl protease family protein At5g10770-like isoform X2 n=1 Tax=Andrographis paniculata TaxID=175694 RepID=UPI0021E6FA34|nr:aspartyl protease family protein At5g10770-like isoform X2 [Andrographis paniculata]